MQYRTLGRTGLRVSAIGFGGIKLPQVSQDEADAALNAALDAGVNFIDTARNYTDSERKIGRAVGERRDEFFLATKSSECSAEAVRRDLETSLGELGFDRIDLYQLHSVSNEAAWRESMGRGGALAAARRAQMEGLIDHVGITCHRDLKVMRLAIESGEFDTIMVCYSVIDSEHVGDEILPLAHEHRMGVIAMKTLSGGMLVSPGFEEGKRAGENDPLVEAAIRFVLGCANVDVVLPGMRNPDEVRQNARLGDECRALSDEERAGLLRTIGEGKRAYRYGQVCLQCGYCRPCPQGIDVSKVLRAAMIQESYPDDLKWMAEEIYRGLEVMPDRCEECGACLKRCPAGLDIPTLLRQTAAQMRR